MSIERALRTEAFEHGTRWPSRRYRLPVILIALIALGLSGLAWRALSTDTEYAPDYSESSFDAIRIGDSEQHVLELLGEPLSRTATAPSRTWLYCDADHPGFDDDGIRGTFTLFRFGPDGNVHSVYGQVEKQSSQSLLSREVRVSITENYLGISPAQAESLKGTSQHEIEARYGQPRHTRQDLSTEYLIYSRSPSSTHYWLRRIGIDANGTVVRKKAYFYWD